MARLLPSPIVILVAFKTVAARRRIGFFGIVASPTILDARYQDIRGFFAFVHLRVTAFALDRAVGRMIEVPMLQPPCCQVRLSNFRDRRYSDAVNSVTLRARLRPKQALGLLHSPPDPLVRRLRRWRILNSWNPLRARGRLAIFRMSGNIGSKLLFQEPDHDFRFLMRRRLSDAFVNQ